MDFGEIPELTTIQRLVDKEHSMEHRWQPASYAEHVQPLVITLNNHLMEVGYDDSDKRRDARLEILRRIVRQNVASTNELSAYQCKVIYGYLVDADSDDYRATEHGARLLERLTDDLEDFGVLEEEQA
jgi:hypothetical protein